MHNKKYGILEQRVIDIFNSNRHFSYNSNQYSVISVCKPLPSSGECKTDVYDYSERSKRKITTI